MASKSSRSHLHVQNKFIFPTLREGKFLFIMDIFTNTTYFNTCNLNLSHFPFRYLLQWEKVIQRVIQY